MEIAEYDPRWPEIFTALRGHVVVALGPLAQRIEHVGSTAVPGLSAKPVIDLDVVIATPADLPEAARRLATIGYRHEGDLGIAGGGKPSPARPPRQHITSTSARPTAPNWHATSPSATTCAPIPARPAPTRN